MKKYRLLAFSATFAFIVISCNTLSPIISTSTPSPEPSKNPLPTPTRTPTATLTATPEPTQTPKPTNSPTPTQEPTFAFGELQTLTEGGYSFRPPLDYEVDIAGAQVGVFDSARKIIISVMGATSNPEGLSAEAIIDEFTSAVFRRGDGDFTIETSHPIEIDGVEGISYEIAGTMFGFSVRGQAIVAMPTNDQYFYGLGIANIEQNKKLWDDKGKQIFDDLLTSIKFTTPGQATSSGQCVVSTDPTYGYSQENPIQVGGGAFGGPSRERVYLDNLSGPNGEVITYQRIGTVPAGNSIQDMFEITVQGKKVILYIDEYAYTELLAPVGFTCSSPFPFSEP